MLKDVKKYVAFDVLEYLVQIKHIVPIEKSFSFQQVLDYVLPSVFMKMTGCLEHKIDMISLHLAMNDEQWRQTMMRKNSSIPSSSEEIVKLVDAITSYITDNFDQGYSCKVWDDEKRVAESAKIICTNLEEIGIADYLGANYIMFANNITTLPEHLTVKLNKGKLKKYDFIKVVYN